MDFTLSKHAEDAMHERGIRPEWVTEAMTAPLIMEPDPDDSALVHALRPIPEFGYRVLCVIFNQIRKPPHIVTAYFDRAMKGKL